MTAFYSIGMPKLLDNSLIDRYLGFELLIINNFVVNILMGK